MCSGDQTCLLPSSLRLAVMAFTCVICGRNNIATAHGLSIHQSGCKKASKLKDLVHKRQKKRIEASGSKRCKIANDAIHTQVVVDQEHSMVDVIDGITADFEVSKV